MRTEIEITAARDDVIQSLSDIIEVQGHDSIIECMMAVDHARTIANTLNWVLDNEM